MASNVLPPQGLLLQTRTHFLQCPPWSKLGFSADFSHRFSATRFSPPPYRVSLDSRGLVISPILSVPARASFTVRSETSSSEPEIEAENEGPEIALESAESLVVSDDAGAEQKSPRKPRIKLGEIMGILNQRAVEARDLERPIPDIRTGDVVEIKLQVPENKRRLAVYKGIVMSRQNAGIHTTIRIRRIIAGVGVEIVFPLYSPSIKEIKVIDQKKVRKARLYYLRDKLPRFSTFK